MGDPSGISPEIIAKACDYFKKNSDIRLIFIGDFDFFQKINDPNIGFSRFSALDTISQFQYIDIPTEQKIVSGRPSSNHAGAIIKWIETGFELCQKNEACALVTAPEAIWAESMAASSSSTLAQRPPLSAMRT
jgi:4-hydroxy-L-threonine phosphate dehydrogenase PdxA